jgi:PadR family transcriptional regulator, regulatory protein PadR
MAGPALQEPTFFILAALASGEAHGYRLLAAIEELSGGRLRLRAGTLYGALDRLERDGYIQLERVESGGGPPRRSYRITDAGRTLLEAEVARLEANATVGRAQLQYGWTG